MIRFALPLVSALLASACSQQAQPPAAEVTADATQSASPVASESAAPSVAAAAAPASRYTSLKNCTVVDDGGGEDWSVSRCQGIGPWSLQIDYGDARDDLRLLRQGQADIKLNLIALGGGGFNALGDTVEWRGAGEGSGFAPSALIVRNSIVEDPEFAERQTGILMVVDLGKGCVVGKVRPSASQNEQARTIADGPARPCMNR